MAYYTSPFGTADGANVTTDVHNQFGPREVGGSEGVTRTEGYLNEYVLNYDGEGPLGFVFPVGEGVYVTDVDETFSTGSVTAITIGGVDISAATDAAPVELDSDNTGVVSVTGPTAGDLVIRFKRLA